jgi:4-hydroxy-tetrahydrodipicolinate synthase
MRLSEAAKGVFIISVTPFEEDGGLDLTSAARLIDFYIDCGVDGITILGMMGEAAKLTPQESTDFAAFVIKRVAGRLPVVVGVSGHRLGDGRRGGRRHGGAAARTFDG